MQKYDLRYLQNKPKRINWKLIVGPPLTYYESYDLIFDKYDLQIRKIT
jgi:hypothetical protein